MKKGGIFAATKNQTPAQTRSSLGSKNLFKEFHMLSHKYGITFEMNPYFPIVTITPLRVALIDPRTIDCIFRAAWQYKKNIGDKKGIQINFALLCHFLKEAQKNSKTNKQNNFES